MPLIRDAAADRRQRRIRVDHAGNVLGVHALGQREPVLGDELAGMRTDDRGAEKLALRIGDDLGEALRFAFGARAIDFVEREAVDLVRDVALLRFGFGQPDARELGIGERAPRDHLRRLRPPQLEDRLAQHDAGVMLGHVRELQPPATSPTT